MLKDVSEKRMGLVFGYVGPSETKMMKREKRKKGGMNLWAQCLKRARPSLLKRTLLGFEVFVFS